MPRTERQGKSGGEKTGIFIVMSNFRFGNYWLGLCWYWEGIEVFVVIYKGSDKMTQIVRFEIKKSFEK